MNIIKEISSEVPIHDVCSVVTKVIELSKNLLYHEGKMEGFGELILLFLPNRCLYVQNLHYEVDVVGSGNCLQKFA